MAEDYDINSLENSSTGTVDWSVYLQKGVIIDLQIKRYRGTTSIAFSELGFDTESSSELNKFLSSYLKPGQKSLIPPEIEGQLKSIETAARQNLKDCSFDCSTFDSQGRFVPASAYADFKKANQEFERRFWAIRDEFAHSYQEIVQRVCNDYKVLAENLYLQSHPDETVASEKYVNDFVKNIKSQIPPKNEIIAQFEYNTFMRKIPDYLLGVIRKKNDIDEKAMRIAATSPVKKAEKKTTAKQKPTIHEVIEADLQESMKDQSEAMVQGFLHEIPMQLRQTAVEGANSVIASIDKNNGKLVGRASIKAHNLVNELKRMDFYGDADLQAMLSSFELSLQESEDSPRDVSEIRKTAVELRDWAQGSMKTMKKNYSPSKRRTPKVKPAQRKPAEDGKVKISVPKNNAMRRTAKNKKGK